MTSSPRLFPDLGFQRAALCPLRTSYAAARIGRWLGPTTPLHIRQLSKRASRMARKGGAFLAIIIWQTAARFGSTSQSCMYGRL